MTEDIATRLDLIRQDLMGEVYDGKLWLGEVGTDDFIFWRNNYTQPELKIEIGKFDIMSALSLFEDWVIHGRIK